MDSRQWIQIASHGVTFPLVAGPKKAMLKAIVEGLNMFEILLHVLKMVVKQDVFTSPNIRFPMFWASWCWDSLQHLVWQAFSKCATGSETC